MDGDPAVESELDAFSLTLPLPYRVGIITVLATWGWSINLHYLHGLKIDVPALIRYPGRSAAAQEPTHHDTAYRLASVASGVLAASLLLFWTLTRRDPERVLALDWLPMATLGALGLLLVLPVPAVAAQWWRAAAARLPIGRAPQPPWALSSGLSGLSGGFSGLSGLSSLSGLPQDGRRRFAATLRRVAVGGLAESQHGKFGDVLLADVLTSYSKVLGDLYVCVCMFFFASRAGREASATDRPDRNCGGGVVVPLIMVMPFVARFRQCLIEYGRARRDAAARGRVVGGARDRGLQHLANAGKYATSFPVILFSALHRSAKAEAEAAVTDASAAAAAAAATRYYRLWVLAVAANSLYSFYWDVARDWDLTLFAGARARNAPDHPWALRRRRYVAGGRPLVYYAAVALDLALRCTWSLKLSPHLDRVADFESSLFLMQLLEVLRRWIWIFFRVETEWIRTLTAAGPSELLLGGAGGAGSSSASLSSSSGGVPAAGMNPTDILLGDYHKYDDDDDDDDADADGRNTHNS